MVTSSITPVIITLMTSTSADKLLQVSLSDEVLDLPLEVVAILGLMPDISVIQAVEVRVPLVSATKHPGRCLLEIVLFHYE